MQTQTVYCIWNLKIYIHILNINYNNLYDYKNIRLKNNVFLWFSVKFVGILCSLCKY